MRILQFIELPGNLQGRISNLCYDLLNNNAEPIAVRVFAMSVLARLAKEWPELSNELLPVIERNLPYASPAFISRVRKIKKELSLRK